MRMEGLRRFVSNATRDLIANVVVNEQQETLVPQEEQVHLNSLIESSGQGAFDKWFVLGQRVLATCRACMHNVSSHANDVWRQF